jgi:TolB protein
VSSYLFPLAGLLFVGTITAIAACPDKNWQLYTDHVYRLTLCIPPGWERSMTVYKNAPYFEGSDGHFQFDAAERDTPLQTCKGSATHHLRPYGEYPKIQSLKINGQPACIVWPSEDQRTVLGSHALPEAQLVVKYPRPIKIVTLIDQPAPVKSIEGIYGQLILTGDEKHILEIAKTLKFQGPK